MKIIKTFIKDLLIIQPQVWKDDRGYFYESFNKKAFKNATGLDVDFVQDNESQSEYGVLRGLHFQTGDFEQAKLVRVIEGTVYDVVVDIRPDSESYGRHFTFLLNGQNKAQLFIPRGCAHGFATITDKAIFSYKCDNYYNKDYEDGINPFDKDLNINWPISLDAIKTSDKDNNHQSFKEYTEKFGQSKN